MSPFLANFSFCFCPLSICERVHSLAAKIFCVCENVRPSLIQTKNGSFPLPFLPVFAFFCTFCPFCPFFYFSLGSAKKFFCRCQHLCRKALHGRARWSASARPLFALFGSAFPAFDSSRKSALAWLSGSKKPYCRFPFFCRALSAVGIFLFHFSASLSNCGEKKRAP